MKKQRHTYHLNPHTLRYEKVFVSLRQRLQGIGFNVLLGVVVGVALVIIGLQFMQSPNERLLRRELDHYRRHTASLNERVERAEKVLLNLEERDDALYRAIFESEPVPRSERYSGIGGVERYADFDGDALLKNTTRRVDNLDKRLYVQSKSLDEVYDMALNKSQRLASLPAIMPVQKDLCQVVSGFGNRFHPILKSHRLHSGIDLAAHPGTPVYATGDAVVRVASHNPQGYTGYGIVVILDHGFGIHLRPHAEGLRPPRPARQTWRADRHRRQLRHVLRLPPPLRGLPRRPQGRPRLLLLRRPLARGIPGGARAGPQGKPMYELAYGDTD